MSFAIRCDRCSEATRTPAPFGEPPEGWLWLTEMREW